MGAMMRAKDWSQTPLGAEETWPQSLKTALSILLDSGYPLYIAWGPQFTQFYNDAYRPILGSKKHPAALGQSTPECFAEIWDFIGPMFQRVMATGASTALADQLLGLDRNGYMEECYFTFSYSAIREETGAVGGVIVTVIETTDRVLDDRRQKTLRELASHAGEALSEDDLCRRVTSAFAANRRDFPFVLLYLLEESERLAFLRGSVGLQRKKTAAPPMLGLEEAVSPWPLAEALKTGRPIYLGNVQERVGLIDSKAWPEHVHAAWLLPLRPVGEAKPLGVLIAGISPRREPDQSYLNFLQLVASQVVTAIATIRAREAERERAAALDFLARLGQDLSGLTDPATIIHRTVQSLGEHLHAHRCLLGEWHADFRHLTVAHDWWAPGSHSIAGVYDLEAFGPQEWRERIASSRVSYRDVEADPVTIPYAANYRMVDARSYATSSLQQHSSGRITIAVTTNYPRAWREAELSLLDHTAARVGPLIERARAERSVREGALALRFALDAAHLGDWSWNAATDGLWLSERAAEIYGAPPGDTLRRADLRQTLHADDQAGARLALEQSVQNHTEYDREYRVLHPSGQLVWVAAKGRGIYAEDGGIIGMRGVVQDITARKLEEARMRRRNELLSLLSESAHDMLAATDANQMVEGLFAKISSRLGLDVFFNADGALSFESPTRDAFAEDELEFMQTIGSFVAMARERLRIAEERREALQREQAASLAKDRFLAVLSHELRTPLTPVLMTVAALEVDPDLPLAIREELKMIRRNVELETKLIDDLLDLSRITNGKLRLQPQAVDLNAAVQHVLSICRTQFLEKGLRLHCALDASAGAVEADPARLQQMLWNILKNAAKFTPEGGEVRVSTGAPSPGRVQVRVSDSGIGIPPEVLPKIFDAFEQGDPMVTRQFGGLGLGLAITKALVELQAGSLWAESAGAGHGAAFTIELPGASPPQGLVIAPPGGHPSADSRKTRLLIVEDHADTARTLGRLLVAHGYAVQTASTVAAALALAARETFDVLVSDIGLPDATGYELMQRLRELGLTKGIAMSGYGMEEDLAKSRAAGFSEHLVKPIAVAQLEEALRRVERRVSSVE